MTEFLHAIDDLYKHRHAEPRCPPDNKKRGQFWLKGHPGPWPLNRNGVIVHALSVGIKTVAGELIPGNHEFVVTIAILLISVAIT